MVRSQLFFLVIAAMCLLSLESIAADIVELDQPFVMADKIKKEKIEPLQLSKGSIGQAMRKLEEIGYICGIPYPKEGWDRFNAILCEQYTSNQYCGVSLILLHTVDWDEKLSDKERLSLVDEKPFRRVMSLCRSGVLEPLQTIIPRRAQ